MVRIKVPSGIAGSVYSRHRLSKIDAPKNAGVWFWIRASAVALLVVGWLVYLAGHPLITGRMSVAAALLLVVSDQVDRVENLVNRVRRHSEE